MMAFYWLVLLSIVQAQARAQAATATANSIRWISPSSGSALTAGQSVEAKWTSDHAIRDPTFSLCTADARCGQASPAQIIDNEDGTTSALLSLPAIDGGSSMFLQMNDNEGGAVHHSPTFRIGSGPSPPGNTLAKSESQDNQALEAESEDYGTETGLVTETGTPSTGVVATGTGGVGAAETSRNPYKWEDEGRSSATATSAWSGSETTDLADTVSSLAREVSSLTGNPFAVPTTFDPSAIPTAYPSQWPFANPYAVLSMTSSPSAFLPSATSSSSSSSSAEGADSTTTTRPNAAIIAVPISICGAILLASLLFCARSRMKSSKDLEAGPLATSGPGNGPAGIPTDWQAMVKRKVLDGTNGEKESHGGGNVTVTERRDHAILPTLGYAQGEQSQQLPPAYRARRGAPMVERYVDDPYTRFDGMHTRRQGYSREGYSRGSRDWERERERERDMRYMGDRSAYSSRSGSGTRCVTPCAGDRSHDHRSDRHSHHSRSSHSRGSKDRYDEYDCPDSHRQSSFPSLSSSRKGDGYYTPSRRSRSGLGGVRDGCDCPSCTPSRRYPHSHSHDISSDPGCFGCHRQDSTSSSGRTRPRTPEDPMCDLPGPTYSSSQSHSQSQSQSKSQSQARNRPLPEPMIRTDSQTHSSDMSSRPSREYVPKARSQPHRSGVLRRADSSTSTDTDAGWHLAGEGAYETSHGRGMGELYESLRRAIGESETGPNHVRM